MIKNNLKINWKTKKVEECLDKINYTKKVQRKDFLESGSFPIVSQEAEFINGYWNNESDLLKTGKPVVIFGDHTQILKYVDFNFVLGADGVKILCPKIFLDAKFLYYFSQSVELKSLGYARHYRLLKEIEISYPESLSEQHRIVKILDEVFDKVAKAKENAEKNLQNAKELFESYLQGVFVNPGKDWEKKKMGECFRLKSGVMLVSTSMNKSGEFLVFGGNGVAGNHDKFNLSGDNVIIGRVGALCGNVRNIKEKIWLTDNAFCVVDFKCNFDNSFLTYLLNFKKLKNFARQTAQPVISNSSLKNLVLQFPKSITEQKSIVTKLDALSAETKKLEAIYKQKLLDLEELKKSVLRRAFEGRL